MKELVLIKAGSVLQCRKCLTPLYNVFRDIGTANLIGAGSLDPVGAQEPYSDSVPCHLCETVAELGVM